MTIYVHRKSGDDRVWRAGSASPPDGRNFHIPDVLKNRSTSWTKAVWIFWLRRTRLLDHLLEQVTFFRVHPFAFTFIPLIFSGIFYASNGRYHVSYVDALFLCYSAMTVTGLSTVDLSTTTGWQQAILYFLMTIVGTTRFFRTHCEYVAEQRRSRRGKRRSIFPTISSPIAAFKQRQPVPVQTLDEERSIPQFDFTGPTPGATLNNGQGNVLPPINEQPEEPILSDVRTFSSSPRQASILLPSPIDERRRSETSVFATATGVSPQVVTYHPMVLREGRRAPSRGDTRRTSNGPGSPMNQTKYRGLGGFPGPLELADKVIKFAAPATHRRLERKLTMPTITTLEEKSVPWLEFDGLVVGRNSNFHTESLTDNQLEEIGGAEYRALRLLSYLVPSYFVGVQLLTLMIFGPWLCATKTYNNVFESQPQLVPKAWFSLFQIMGAYTGGGLSLVDAGMVPFEKAYPMIFALGFSILAGNHALVRFVYEYNDPILFVRSLLSCCLCTNSTSEAFASSFPDKSQLDIGLPAYDSIPVGPRVIAGLFQGLAVRASGFSIVPIASLAPSLQFLYVVMMYIAVYPDIAFPECLKRNHRYEEQSLGVFERPPDQEDEEPNDLGKLETRRERVGRYVGWHLRRQMSIDIWWLVWGVFLVAIIERNNLLDESKKWFDIFRILFELVSAFGGIGLSLGFPDDNFAFSGTLRPLSKLVVIVIMLRGRHRGLPVAVDRAVLLPDELVVHHGHDEYGDEKAITSNPSIPTRPGN
ncbi:uncharacterized protein LACBIDRAFT_326076 [Laccaria bicolor S238N-H82]|uniref:Predicted protein n=1 Tax=Laccaria bicolor (strain S238N-H82 / ATCC MYA-4686) TaxID=486041 RepID=B0D780_LACBS|nr:uncharacterized protein LACBIDRAFT_326076 [Laccaria bicolor S238N-H82]EDR09603.1 predicted protein [Laccaria bicolor S238N-H82]|eukprot:XP_001879952.1 predicted protein [Laccaria bicolor S238N-H82]